MDKGAVSGRTSTKTYHTTATTEKIKEKGLVVPKGGLKMVVDRKIPVPVGNGILFFSSYPIT
jgi:hypothetical protein